MGEFRGWGGSVIVTGASEGIGQELARRFADRGSDLVLVARSGDRLERLAEELVRDHGVKALPVPLDLATPDGPARLAAIVSAADLPVDVLVNNAAFGTYGPFARGGVDREAEMIRLDVSTPTLLTALLLPGMLERGRGLILNVASTAAFAPVPWLGTYAATKAYLVSWTRALAVELKGSGVRACALCPGTTETRFHRVSGADTGQRFALPAQSSAEVAQAAMRGIDRGRTVIVPGMLNRVHAVLARLLPSGLAARMTGLVMHPKDGVFPEEP